VLYCHFPGAEGTPRSVLRELFERFPATREAFARHGVFLIEFEAGSIDGGLESTQEAEEAAGRR
jgi:hypothetical protein